MSYVEIGLLFYLAVVIIVFLATLKDFNNVDRTPAKIYDHTNLNYLGVTVLFMIYFILDPIGYFCYFVYWIFHVGRE